MPSSEPPYTPGYGLAPPLLAGRDELLSRAWAAMKAGAGHPDLHQVWVGERGVGKTVAAQWVASKVASELGWAVIRHQAVADEEALAVLVRRLPEALSSWRRMGREFRQLEKQLTLSVNLGVLAVSTTVRSGTEAIPVATVFESLVRQVGDFARKHNTGLLLSLDEAHSLERRPTLAALSRSLQTANVERLPIAAILTGLPSLPERFEGAGTYIQRVQKRDVEDLTPDAARLALVEPAARSGTNFAAEALDLLVGQTRGRPYYVQLFGYHSWLAAGSADEINLAHAHAGVQGAYRQLDLEFEPAWKKLSPLERSYVIALVTVGPYQAPAEEVARALGRTTRQLSSTRDRLIKVHQVLQAPAFGIVEFRQAHFADWALHRRVALHTPVREIPRFSSRAISAASPETDQDEPRRGGPKSGAVPSPRPGRGTSS